MADAMGAASAGKRLTSRWNRFWDSTRPGSEANRLDHWKITTIAGSGNWVPYKYIYIYMIWYRGLWHVHPNHPPRDSDPTVWRGSTSAPRAKPSTEASGGGVPPCIDFPMGQPLPLWTFKGCTQKWMVFFWGKIPLKWMIEGYPHLWKPPYIVMGWKYLEILYWNPPASVFCGCSCDTFSDTFGRKLQEPKSI